MEGGSQDSQESSREPWEAVAKTGLGEMRLHYRWELVAKEVQGSISTQKTPSGESLKTGLEKGW